MKKLNVINSSVTPSSLDTPLVHLPFSCCAFLAAEVSTPYLAPPWKTQLMRSSRPTTTSIAETSIVDASADVSHWRCIFATFLRDTIFRRPPHQLAATCPEHHWCCFQWRICLLPCQSPPQATASHRGHIKTACLMVVLGWGVWWWWWCSMATVMDDNDVVARRGG